MDTVRSCLPLILASCIACSTAWAQSTPPVYPPLSVVDVFESDSTVELTWAGAWPGNGPRDLPPPIGANVYRQDAGEGAFSIRPFQAGARLNEAGDSLILRYNEIVTPGTMYRYVARPFDEMDREGAPTDTANVLAAQFARAPLLTNIRAEGDSVGVRLSWDPLTEPYFEGVKIWRGASLSGPFAVLDTAAADAGVYLDRTAPSAQQLYYRFLALMPRMPFDTPQATVAGSWQDPNTPPPPATDVTVTRAGADVEVRWAAPEDTSGVSGARVLRSLGTPGDWDVISFLLPNRTTTYRDTSSLLRGDAVYFYTVETMSRSGTDGFLAAPASIRPDRRVDIPAPVGVTALTDYGAVTLRWPSVADFTGLAEGYRVYRAEGDAAPERLTPEVVRGLSWTDTSAVVGQRYRYRVTTVAVTGSESAEGAETEVTLPVQYLTVPGVRAFRVGADSVYVTWGGIDYAPLVGYSVLRRAAGTETYTSVATLGADVHEWVDPSAPSGRVVYAVAARYADGGEARGSEAVVPAAEEP